jgi:hypothetical protein
MESDLQTLFGLHVHSCTHWLRPHNPPPPPFGLIYEGAIGQPRKTTSLCDPLTGVNAQHEDAMYGSVCGSADRS